LQPPGRGAQAGIAVAWLRGRGSGFFIQRSDIVPTITRALTGASLTFDLNASITELSRDPTYRRVGRVGKTLVKDGPLRLTLMLIAEGVDAGTHHAEAPMTLQVVSGRLRYALDGADHTLQAGEVLFFGPGHAQDIRALEDAALLLTITSPELGAS
jgi:quercetin dioxygenase-like cupin family protein